MAMVMPRSKAAVSVSAASSSSTSDLSSPSYSVNSVARSVTQSAARKESRNYPRVVEEGDNGLITLSPRKQSEMFDTINTTVANVLESMVGDRPSRIHWKSKLTKKGVSYYVDDNVNQDQYRFCCVSETTAPTEDVMQLFQITDTETLLKNNRIVYNNVLDARILSVLEYPTRENPFKSVYVRYSSFAAPSPMDNRDVCVVVATDVFTHEDGSTIGYCLMDSVDIPECPDYYKSHGLVRGRLFRSGFFMRTSDTTDSLGNLTGGKTTKIVYLIGAEFNGVAPRLAARFVMERFGANLSRLCSYFRRRNLNPMSFCPRSEWKAKSTAKACRACFKKFGKLSKRTNCAACGDVVCKACYSTEKVDLPGVGITPMRFCLTCLGERGLEAETKSPATSASETVRTTRLPRHHRRNRTMSRTEITIELPQLLASLSTSELDAFSLLSQVSSTTDRR